MLLIICIILVGIPSGPDDFEGLSSLISKLTSLGSQGSNTKEYSR